MLNYLSLIRLDREFIQSTEAARAELEKKNPLPIIINGLTGGASDAYVVEAISELKAHKKTPALVLTQSETERKKLAELLNGSGINALMRWLPLLRRLLAILCRKVFSKKAPFRSLSVRKFLFRKLQISFYPLALPEWIW